MLPTVPIPATRLTAEESLSLPPIRPTTGVIDVLSEFVPGEKLIALIQAQLPNGAFRATIAQRDVTLALPFSAKPGDSLELEVVETAGRVAFAVSRPKTETGHPASSAPTTLSQTGQLIARLLGEPGRDTSRPAVLNTGQPILPDPAAPPGAAAPALQKALVQSGLFYESHQAAWLAGDLPEAALRKEPQARMGAPLPPQNMQNSAPNAAQSAAGAPTPPRSAPSTPPGGEALLREAASGLAPRVPAAYATPEAAPEKVAAPAAGRPAAGEVVTMQAGEAGRPTGGRAGLPPELAPIVQQQLAGLAGDSYSFQGAIWAGQPFFWEIVDENQRRAGSQGDEGQPRPWKTRLKLLLPSLGDIDATIRLDGSDVSVEMSSGTGGTPDTLRSARERLRERMELAGLRLTALDIRAPAADDGPENDDEPTP